MTKRKRAPSREALRAVKKRHAAKRAAPYHHGSLREAMLRAAENILERDGIGGLTLRQLPVRRACRTLLRKITSETSWAC